MRAPLLVRLLLLSLLAAALVILAGMPGRFGVSPPNGVEASTTAFTKVSAGGSHTCAARTDATLACWGDNGNGQSTRITASGCAPLPSGVASWWPMDVIAGTTTPDIVSHDDGTLVNGPVSALGKVTNALSFDGVDDYVDVPYDPRLDAGAAFTVELWLKANPSQMTVFTIVDKSHRSFQEPPLYSGWTIQGRTDAYPGQLSFSVGNGVGFATATTTNSVLDDAWHHIAGVFDGSSVRVYFDGLPQDSAVFSGTSVSNTGPLNIGRLYIEADRYFHGLIDEVTIYDRALSSAEIEAIFAADSAGKCEASVGGIAEFPDVAAAAPAVASAPADHSRWPPAKGTGLAAGLAAALLAGTTGAWYARRRSHKA